MAPTILDTRHLNVLRLYCFLYLHTYYMVLSKDIHVCKHILISIHLRLFGKQCLHYVYCNQIFPYHFKDSIYSKYLVYLTSNQSLYVHSNVCSRCNQNQKRAHILGIVHGWEKMYKQFCLLNIINTYAIDKREIKILARGKNSIYHSISQKSLCPTLMYFFSFMNTLFFLAYVHFQLCVRDPLCVHTKNTQKALLQKVSSKKNDG